ncbi:hypothetical protein [Peterkaempfera bronchialis]|uniref:Uncharacterized protein n=1 Tax=Peterkaempfera bronchialis TaxID=2126346 RepID=A0A345SUC4_9ACTN|nr:hypothetical protein [Peterkaempfera bronchialis]AXI77329.1 hypothetical protein C7M71_007625 [Peterkaempfera bronchialis]
MSEAFTDTTENRAAEAAAMAGVAGRHRGAVARDDGTVAPQPETGHGRHRRLGESFSTASSEA